MTMTLELTPTEFWLVRSMLEREIKNYHELVASSVKWQSPSEGIFRQGLETREALLGRLDAAHPIGVKGVREIVAEITF